MFELNKFISEKVILREESMFLHDVESNKVELKNKIINKSILVIGGAGSIGSSFIKALLPFKPQTVVVIDINENALAELARDLRSSKNIEIPEEFILYPMSYTSDSFQKLFKHREGFDIVANFSAHKHVRSEKDVYSIEALLQNNVVNAKDLLELLSKYPPETYFCVSTDKAANPVNIMGASKRIMEDLIFSYSNQFPVKTARFANVAFSNGSLPAGFLERIRKMQPLSAPLDVKRYFVSPEESGQICLLACILGENREIFFPKLKEAQMKTFDKIAEDLLYEYGYKAFYCSTEKEAIDKSIELQHKNIVNGKMKYPVFFSVSDTSGEKGYEEFYTRDEDIDMSRFCELGVIINKKRKAANEVDGFLENLKQAFKKDIITKKEIVELITDYLPEFKHIETGKSLDSKM